MSWPSSGQVFTSLLHSVNHTAISATRRFSRSSRRSQRTRRRSLASAAAVIVLQTLSRRSHSFCLTLRTRLVQNCRAAHPSRRGCEAQRAKKSPHCASTRRSPPRSECSDRVLRQHITSFLFHFCSLHSRARTAQSGTGTALYE